MPRDDLREAGAVMRALALDFDATAAALDELAFGLWRENTVFPASVNRWIEDCRP